MPVHFSFAQAWNDLDVRFRVALSQAWSSFRSRGLPVGAVVAINDEVVSVGRNRVYDPAGGDDPLQRTPLAHAEMNAIASAPEDVDLSDCDVWTTHSPCSMCSAAIEFTEIATVHYLATDPSSTSSDLRFASSGRSSDLWVVVANALFLHNVAWVAGEDHPIVSRCQRLEPEITSLALGLVADETLIAPAAARADVADALSLVWSSVEAVQRARR